MRPKKKRRKSIWVLVPKAPEPLEPPPVDEREYTEEEVKTACELSLFFMLLFVSDAHRWFMICVEQSCSYPLGSYRNTFWWSMRYIPSHGMEDFRTYLPWKINEFDSGRIRRDGPRW